jgi:hypothetical protein
MHSLVWLYDSYLSFFKAPVTFATGLPLAWVVSSADNQITSLPHNTPILFRVSIALGCMVFPRKLARLGDLRDYVLGRNSNFGIIYSKKWYSC